jgi:hypothetical protein
VADKYSSLSAAIWKDPLPDHVKAGALLIVVARGDVYRRFFTANAAATWGHAYRGSHVTRFWVFDYERCKPRLVPAGLILHLAKNERELNLYKGLKVAANRLKAKVLGVANDAI